MGFIYIDESIHEKERIIVIAAVYSEEDLSPVLDGIMKELDLDPNDTEYKSSVKYAGNEAMLRLRNKLKDELHRSIKLGIAIIPANQRHQIAYESLKAAKQFITCNNLPEPVDIYLDQGMTKDNEKINEFIAELHASNSIHIEQDSKIIKGIQLADLAAHCVAIKFKCDTGIIKKIVKVKDDSIYEEIDLGFEMFATLRYSFFTNTDNPNNGQPQHIAANISVFPNGLYLSDLADEALNETVKGIFGKVYLGCIH